MGQAVPFETAPTTFARELKQKLETKKRDSDMHKKENKRAKDKLQVLGPAYLSMSLFQNIKFFQDNAVPGVSSPTRVARGGDGGL